MQEKTELLNTVSTQLGLNINRSKTKIMKANTKNNNPLTLNGEPLEETDSFTYMGSTATTTWRHRRRRQSKDIESKSCIHHVEKHLESKTNQIYTKLRISNSNVKAVLFYGSETWRSTQKTLTRIQTFINKCLRRILHLKWTDKVSNTTLWKMTKQLTIENEIKNKKWRWI